LLVRWIGSIDANLASPDSADQVNLNAKIITNVS
jgi:hypothetical protein